jgi:ferredoxin-NADP reductase
MRWHVAEVTGIREEAPGVRTLILRVPDWPGHLAGQHAEIRLTAEDGYTAARDYSIASAPEDPDLAFTVERLDDGEVSPYLVDVVEPGDGFEVSDPIGLHFVWTQDTAGPLLLIAGGSGVVPFRSMLRHRRAIRSEVAVRLVYSVRSPGDLIYREELDDHVRHAGVEVVEVYTRVAPPDFDGYRRRIDRQILSEVAWPPEQAANVYVCGPTGFVEAAAGALVDLGHDPGRIKTERFGGT